MKLKLPKVQKHQELILRKNQATIVNDESRFKIVVCGRRFGKTGIDAMEIMKTIQKPNMNTAYVAPTNKQAKEVFWDWIKRTVPNDWKLRTFETAPYTIELLNGSAIRLYGADAHDRIRGRGYDLIVCDEFQDYSPDAWFTSIFPSLSDRQGRAVLTGTPKGKSNWGYELTQNPLYKFFHFTTLDGGWVKQSEIELAKQMLPEMEFRQEFEASFETSGLIVYHSYSALNQTYDYTLDVSRETYLAFDFNVSPMSCIVIQKINDTQFACVKEFLLNNSNTTDMCEVILEYFDNYDFNGTIEVTGDNAGHQRKTSSASVSGTDWVIIREMLAPYLKSLPKTRRTKTVKDRVLALNAMFRNTNGDVKMFVNPQRCPKLHKDLVNVEWIDSGFQLNTVNKDLTHASDALSYFAYNYFPTDYHKIIAN